MVAYTMDTHTPADYPNTTEGKDLPIPHCMIGSDGWQMNSKVYDAICKRNKHEDDMKYTGYTAWKEEDRRKLYIRDIYPLKRKRDGKHFGYSILTQSIGSGIESRFTVFNRVYEKEQVKKGDIIECTGYTRDGQYFTMTGYRKLFDDEMEGIT